MQLRRILATTAAVLSAAALAACGEKGEVERGHTEGVQVTTGELQYQVQISRQLNQDDPTDREYLMGVPAEERELAADETWFATFLRVWNRTEEEHPVASEFEIHDTTGAVFEPIEIDPASNPSVFQPRPLGPEGELPIHDTAGRYNTAQGGLILFKMPTASLENRPLEFIITSPTGEGEAEVTLDV